MSSAPPTLLVAFLRPSLSLFIEQEQKRKLFHTPIYESSQQLKQLYVHTCKRLPAYGCQIWQVKELLHGKAKGRKTRLLGICLERIVLLDSKTLQPAKVQSTSNLQQWRTGGGRSHDRLVLEFRGTKWSFVTPSHGSLRAIGTVLWEIMQDLDACFLDTLIAGERRQDQRYNSQEGRHLPVRHFNATLFLSPLLYHFCTFCSIFLFAQAVDDGHFLPHSFLYLFSFCLVVRVATL